MIKGTKLQVIRDKVRYATTSTPVPINCTKGGLITTDESATDGLLRLRRRPLRGSVASRTRVAWASRYVVGLLASLIPRTWISQIKVKAGITAYLQKVNQW